AVGGRRLGVGWVPGGWAARGCQAPGNPRAIEMVAFATLRLSGSDTDKVGESWMVLPSRKDTLEVTEVRVGASLTAVMLTVVVWGALPTLKSSFTTQVTVRVGSEP